MGTPAVAARAPGARVPRARALDRRALDVALARADAYRVLAEAFRDPDGPDGVEDLAAGVLRSASRTIGASVGPAAWRALRPVVGREGRASEHRAIFGHTVAHGCPPYETEYGRRHVFGQAQELGDIRGFYEAFGVRPRRGGERPDHVACQFEFLALLGLKEGIAIAAGDEERSTICRTAQRRFLADHLGRWMPALAGRIAARHPGSGHGALAAIGAAVVAAHARAAGALPVILGPDDVEPITDEPDGLRFECGVDAEAPTPLEA